MSMCCAYACTFAQVVIRYQPDEYTIEQVRPTPPPHHPLPPSTTAKNASATSVGRAALQGGEIIATVSDIIDLRSHVVRRIYSAATLAVSVVPFGCTASTDVRQMFACFVWLLRLR